MTTTMKNFAPAVLALLLISGLSVAADKEKVVLQLTDDGPERQALVLNVAQNLKKLYGEEAVDVEIVAFGPGLKMLFANNKNARRIDDLVLKGVRFSACLVTTKKIERKTGKTPKLHPDAVLVEGGIVRIIDLVKQGYTLVRP